MMSLFSSSGTAPDRQSTSSALQPSIPHCSALAESWSVPIIKSIKRRQPDPLHLQPLVRWGGAGLEGTSCQSPIPGRKPECNN